ncbi:MAG TPA: hypothetical protein VLZ83_03025 [Edaphocola sp.]|nr:hypothetical protein [Edaphocola sp.]
MNYKTYRFAIMMINNETEEPFYKNITAERIQKHVQLYLIQEDFHELTVI